MLTQRFIHALQAAVIIAILPIALFLLVNTDVLNQIIDTDEARKNTQKKLDETLTKSKSIAKEIF